MKKEKKEVLEYPYTVKDLPCDKASMSLIDIVNQRQIRNTQVNSILRGLKQGQHFDSMFVVNVNNGSKRIRVIDGGHRTEALKRYFEEYPNKQVKVSLAVYKDLTDAEERAIFTRWNIGVKQTIEDFINSYKAEIPEFEYMLDQLPVSVYGTKNKMKMRYIVDAYLSSKTQPYTGGCGYARLAWLDAFKRITSEDIITMKDTFGVIKRTFNPNDIVDFTRLPAFKTAVFKAVFRLIHINKVMLGKEYVIKRMKKVLANSAVLEQFRGSHRTGTIELEILFRQMLNSGVDHKFK
ncbi:MAG: hypothetical protein ACTSQY_09340 [Candidatus Odinarchaeia archaeon]